MNSDECQFEKETVSFVGMEITKYAIRPAGEYLDTIRNIPMLNIISSLRSYYGMIDKNK